MRWRSFCGHGTRRASKMICRGFRALPLHSARGENKSMSATAIVETPTTKDFETKLDRLAQVAIQCGLGLAKGQELVMTASTEALPLARLITKHAYQAGASLVTLLLND